MGDDSNILGEMKAKLKEFCEVRDWDQFHSPKDLAIALILEAGEVLEPFRFKSDSDMETYLSDISNKEKVGEELADVFWFLLRFAQKYNFDLTDELNKKISINENRYSIEKVKGSNKKYNELS